MFPQMVDGLSGVYSHLSVTIGSTFAEARHKGQVKVLPSSSGMESPCFFGC